MLGIAIAGMLVAAADPRATALLDSTIDRMGGRAALERVHRLRVDQITEWNRVVMDDRPQTPVSSYEWSTELRDYQRPAWRYVRRNPGPTGWREIINVVPDTVGTIQVAGTPIRALSVAYVDERDELFATSPERVVLLARAATDLRLTTDTTIGGVPHARVRATINRRPATLYLNRRTHLPAMVQMRAGQPRDFGLAPWGDMDLQIRYSRWQKQAQAGIAYPTQFDIYRAGRPYKKNTWLSVSFNPEIPADSFAVSDSMRTVFFATQNRAMHDVTIDTARITDRAFAIFGAAGTPNGALKVGGQWVIFEGGVGAINGERSIDWLKRADPSPVAMVLMTSHGGSGAIPFYGKSRIPVRATAGAIPYARASLAGYGLPSTSITPLAASQWVRIGTDSLRVETLDLPDYPGASIIYSPTHRWAYSQQIPNGLNLDMVLEHIRRRGWIVERIAGSARPFTGVPIPAK